MKRLNIVFAIVALVMVGTLVASAQSGGGYDLSWYTVGSGGYMWSQGNGYDLGGAIGQAESQGPATGGGYNLQGGFWHPVCSPQSVTINLSCSAPILTLSWASIDANISYDIYRNTTPYFEPSPANRIHTTTGESWNDPEGCGATGQNYYYVVRSTCIGAHADANNCGEFDFGLVPGN